MSDQRGTFTDCLYRDVCTLNYKMKNFRKKEFKYLKQVVPWFIYVFSATYLKKREKICKYIQ